MRLATRFTFDEKPAMAWEECACPLCGGDVHTPVVEAPDSSTGLRFLVVHCNECGMAFTNPRPHPQNMSRFYRADYQCHRAKLPTFKRDPLSRFLPLQGLARLLDFGCGSGDFMMRMHAEGWNVVGIDPSDVAVRAVRTRGMIAHLGSLPHAELGHSYFEAISMRQSLEHVPCPLETLTCARRMLIKGGRLVVSVPNFDCLARHWFGADWFGLDLPRHLLHFSPATLRRILERAGFNNIELHQATRAGWIRHSAGLAIGRGAKSRWLRLLKTRLASKWAGRWARWRGRAETLIAVADKM